MVLALALAALFATIAAAALAPLVIAAGVTDFPDRVRKVHKTPTPTSGGVAIGAGFTFSIALILLMPGLEAPAAIGRAGGLRVGLATAFALAALALGIVDDLRPLSARVKSALMIALSVGVATFVAHAERLCLVGDYAIDLGVGLGIAGSAIWVFVLMNVTNFMDGANGLAMGSTAISLAGLAAVSVLCGAPAAALMAIAGAGALLGFLVWNWPGGKLFAGDSGALFAGVLSAAASLVAIEEGGVSPFIMPILFFPLLADALLTLTWRAGRRRNLLQGHREHLYQIGMRAGVEPAHIAVFYWLATLGCVAAAIGAAALWRYASQPLPNAGADMKTFAVFAALSPKIVLLAVILAAIGLSMQVRAFAVAHGHDSE